jgi:SAM-dependent methyltransferase
MNCRYDKAILLGTRVVPDFDVAAGLSPDLRAAFSERLDGICVRCGIYQAYKRFTLEQLRIINSSGKDVTTSDQAFHTYPAPSEYVDNHNAIHYVTRTRQWKDYLRERGVRPSNALFIRPYFGAAVKFVRDEYGARVAGLDMSDVCIRTTQAIVPAFQPLRGAINGVLEGDFLSSGPYDSVFVFHTLTHACDIHDSIAKIVSLLSPGGFAVFSDEVMRKPANPFHMIHMSEMQLRSILRNHFSRVDRIDACDRLPAPSVADLTVKGDNPDLVAWK